MKALLDSTLEFEEKRFEVKSWERSLVERSVCGLDGVVKVDLGRRSRKVIQDGTIRADNEDAIAGKVGCFAALVDGAEHTLMRGRSSVMVGLVVSSFAAGEVKRGGAGVWCDFEIRYVQVRES